MRIPVPDEIPPAADLGRVHFVGIGGAGAVRRSRGSWRGRASPVTGSDDHDTPFLPSLREIGVPCHLSYDAEHVGDADTARGHHRRPRRQPRGARGAGPGACGSCPARPG